MSRPSRHLIRGTPDQWTVDGVRLALNRADLLDVPGVGSLSLAHARNRMHEAPVAEALGAHLWSALRRALGGADAGDLVLDVEDSALRAWPWHLLRDAQGYLADRGRLVVVADPLARPTVPLGSRRLVLVAGEERDPSLAAWEDALGGTPVAQWKQVRSAERLEDCDASDGAADVLHLVLDADAPQGFLQADRRRPWKEVEAEVERLSPRLVVLDLPGPLPLGVAEAASALVRAAGAVLVAPRAADQPPVAPELVARTIEGRRLAEVVAEAGRGAAGPDRPRLFGDIGGTGKEAAVDAHERWLEDEGWRLRLDRTEPALLLGGTVQQVWRQRRMAVVAGRRVEGAAILAWLGPRDGGLERFHQRLLLELKDSEVPVEPVSLGWPELSPTSADWTDIYREWAKLAWDAPLDRLAERWDLVAPARGSQTVAFFAHRVLRDEGDLAVVLGDYAAWWVEQVVKRAPPRVTPVLALSAEDPDGALRPRLEATLKAEVPITTRVEVRVATPLDRVTADDIFRLLTAYELGGRDTSDDDRQAVAAWIVARTGGRWEYTIRLIELLPWSWRYHVTLARRSRR